MTERFNYVIARKWEKTDKPGDAICVYTYGHEVFNGTMDDAVSMRDFIQGRTDEEGYEIYPVMGEPLKTSL